jgi:hypothetical protein
MTASEIRAVLKLMDKYSYDHDEDGQVVIYTGVYEHSDRKYYDEPESEYEDDDNE